MEANPVPYYCHNPVPPHRRQPRPPQFGGIGDAVSSMVGLIDSNRLVELVATDGIGMILPRTGMAFKMRGPDDGRETFLREISGLVGNMFVVGWASKLMMGLLGNSVNRYNPQGIPAKAWVNSENFQAFGKLYKQALNDSRIKLPDDARRAFIQYVLAGLESGDKQFSIESRVASLQKLKGEAQKRALAQMVETIGDTSNLSTYQALLNDPEQLKREFLKKGWGQLSQDSQAALYEYFEQAEGVKGSLKGTHNFDARAAERVKELLPDAASNPKAAKQAFIEHRLAFSLDDLRSEAEKFQKAIDHDALARGLTGTINLKDSARPGAKIISHNQSRGSFLKELKFFLEQYVDRAAYAAGDQLDWKDNIKRLLFDDSQKGIPLLNKIVPHAEDGLIAAAKKSKFAYTWIPLGIAVMAGGAFTFYNNYLTMKKHGGKVFFPGEGMPPQEAPISTHTVPFSGAASQPTPLTSGFRNTPGGAFANYRQSNNQARNFQGGTLA